MKVGVTAYVILLAVLFSGGCETAKGFAKGAACTVGSTMQGAGEDFEQSRNFILRADDWIKKNLW